MAARQIRWQALDAALSALLTAAAVAEVTLAGYGPVTATFAAIVTVTLNWRRTHPLTVLIVGAAAWTVPILLGLVPSEAALTPLVALLIGVYSVARHADTRRAVLGAAVALAASLASDFKLTHPGIGDFGFTAILISWPWFAGYALRSHALANSALADRASLLEAERDAKALAAVAAERGRLARELHDIIAHCVSVMVVQASAAEAVIDREPDKAREALHRTIESGRAALVDLRTLLGLLRDGGMAPVLAPQPGIGDLEALATQVRAAGLPVQLRLEGEPVALPRALDLAVFRIVQEGLTNTLKHAGAAQSTVVVRYQPGLILVSVSDDGNGVSIIIDKDGPGHGLVGMRERVTLHGGELEAGPLPGGGYQLTARLPLDDTQLAGADLLGRLSARP
jgi:signal transduction histidine kinase